MGRSRFVSPATNTKRLQLPGGDWVEVKKQLTVGEERAAFQQAIGEVNADGWRRPNVEMLGLSEVHAYIVDWGGDGFRDDDGRSVQPTLAALQSMRSQDYKELETAIKAHIAAMDEEEQARKNGKDGEPASAAISPSVG